MSTPSTWYVCSYSLTVVRDTPVRVAVCGLGGVGKSCLTIQFVQNQFISHWDPTIEDSYQKTITYNNEEIRVDILDTAGQDEYIGLRDEYMRTCDGFLLVVDLTNKKTLDGLEAFRTQIMRSKDTNNPLIFIAANKCDLPDSDKAVTKDDLETIKKKWNNVGYLETSAKERKNVDEAFMKVIEMVLTKRKPSTTVKKKEKKCLIL